MAMSDDVSSRRVDVRIDRFVLKGFTPEGGRAAIARFRAELAARLAEGDAPFGPSRFVRRLDPPPLPASEPGALGAAVARAIVRGLKT
jgi:hypothetical protein